jgi:hypothetical protein
VQAFGRLDLGLQCLYVSLHEFPAGGKVSVFLLDLLECQLRFEGIRGHLYRIACIQSGKQITCRDRRAFGNIDINQLAIDRCIHAAYLVFRAENARCRYNNVGAPDK